MTNLILLISIVIFTLSGLIIVIKTNTELNNKTVVPNFEVGDRVQFIAEYVHSIHVNKKGTVIISDNKIGLWLVRFDDGSDYEVGYHGFLIKLEGEE